MSKTWAPSMIVPNDCFDPKLTANDRVATYFEHIFGRPMTREEKIPLGIVIHGDTEMEDSWGHDVHPAETAQREMEGE